MQVVSDWLDSCQYLAVWLQAIGTVGALLWLTADFTYFRPNATAKKDLADKQAQIDRARAEQLANARAVAGKFRVSVDGSGQAYTLWYRVKNSSPYPVDAAELVIPGVTDPSNPQHTFVYRLGTLLPHDLLNSRVAFDGNALDPASDYTKSEVQLTFWDVSGSMWLRTEFECRRVVQAHGLEESD